VVWATVTVAVVASLVILAVKPAWGLVVYLGVVLLYPDYLRIVVGTFEISAGRIVAAVLVLSCLAKPAVLRRFRWSVVDSLVTLGVFVYTATLLCTTPAGDTLKNQSGFVLDTISPYFAARLTMANRNCVVTLIRGTTVILLLLSVMGVMEAITRTSPYDPLKKYSLAGRVARTNEQRYGFLRAQGPHSHSIMFGMSLATLIPLTSLLRQEPPPCRRLSYVAFAVVSLGVFSSLSSGPILQYAVVLVWLVLERWPGFEKILLLSVAAACVAIEIVGSRSFYYVLSDLAFDPVSGYYRARLIDVAISHLPEYWACGYGLARDPGWGPEIIGIDITDTVNQYVYVACVHGLPGLLAFVAPFCVVIPQLRRMGRLATDRWSQSCFWGASLCLIGLVVMFWTVCVFGVMISITYCVLGLGASLCSWRPARRVRGRRRLRPGSEGLTEKTRRPLYV
jgi:hypothetical protein